jgi:hypothetical protein
LLKDNKGCDYVVNDIFLEFIALSAKLRSEYPSSLGNSFIGWENVIKTIEPNIPLIYKIIYGKVSGTMRNIKNQTLMDFIPGYRLIHIQELEKEKTNLEGVLQYYESIEGLTLLPILANYSSDFICYGRDNSGLEKIYRVNHDDDLELLYESPEKFFKTICEFYKQGVYFLDQDGYLDYDFDRLRDVSS